MTRRIRMVPRPIEEMSNSQIECLMAFGRQEAELLDELELAVHKGNRELVWQLAEALCSLRDQEGEV